MELFSSGAFPLWSLREGVRHARFRLMSDVDVGVTGYFDARISRAEVEMFLTLAAEKRGESFYTFTSEPHERTLFSTNTELQSPPHEECTNCKKTHPNLKKCGACGKVQYCCKECQRKHWKEHKSNCKTSSTAPTSTPASCGRCKKQSTLIPCSCGSVSRRRNSCMQKYLCQ